jgi:hypothetical protein
MAAFLALGAWMWLQFNPNELLTPINVLVKGTASAAP